MEETIHVHAAVVKSIKNAAVNNPLVRGGGIFSPVFCYHIWERNPVKMKIFFGILCILSIGYYAAIISYAGLQATFSKFWLLAGAVFLFLFLLLGRMQSRGRSLLAELPIGIRIAGAVCLIFAFVLFAAVELLIAAGMYQRPPKGLDYIIVLGAKVKGDVPSKSLYKRLYAAEAYMKENPETIAVLSGGQGPGENLTEAQAMETYLLGRGISQSRLRLEDKSTDTVENMRYSKAWIQKKNASVGVVTNDFHVYRGVAVGKKLGYERIYGIPASSDWILQVNYLMREFFAVVKDKICGNI